MSRSLVENKVGQHIKIETFQREPFNCNEHDSENRYLHVEQPHDGEGDSAFRYENELNDSERNNYHSQLQSVIREIKTETALLNDYCRRDNDSAQTHITAHKSELHVQTESMIRESMDEVRSPLGMARIPVANEKEPYFRNENDSGNRPKYSLRNNKKELLTKNKDDDTLGAAKSPLFIENATKQFIKHENNSCADIARHPVEKEGKRRSPTPEKVVQNTSKGKHLLTAAEWDRLMGFFTSNNYPSHEEKSCLGEELGIPYLRVCFFQ